MGIPLFHQKYLEKSKCVNEYFHSVITTMHNHPKLEARWLGYSYTIEDYIHRCSKCAGTKFSAIRNLDMCMYGSHTQWD